MFAYVNPEEGRIPAFKPTCPGIHCGFCCAWAGPIDMQSRRAMTAEIVPGRLLMIESPMIAKRTSLLGLCAQFSVMTAPSCHPGRADKTVVPSTSGASKRSRCFPDRKDCLASVYADARCGLN